MSPLLISSSLYWKSYKDGTYIHTHNRCTHTHTYQHILVQIFSRYKEGHWPKRRSSRSSSSNTQMQQQQTQKTRNMCESFNLWVFEYSKHVYIPLYAVLLTKYHLCCIEPLVCSQSPLIVKLQTSKKSATAAATRAVKILVAAACKISLVRCVL